ncbi:penicillin-binding transpeptidase domain-containing protein [Priestia koreensis]|uniref:penicillin-binding transpeptidase domain-containing protein n=1 Tax=Priestia koreensis TaxID=284581 RepID=UPI001F578A69|nr:penicillin-binding transpeptidase domain-containing protein [Priestia koreensis]UNL83037.1 penicillin-binding transpeptidase domain-containing protein [Priestia koreensis]
MKKIIALAMMLMVIFALAACSNTDDGKKRLDEYVSLWNKQDFDQMYSYLSTKSKKQISKKEFVDRYKRIYSGVDVKDLSVKVTSKKDVKEKDGELPLKVDVNMQTAGGEVSFSQNVDVINEKQQDDENWYVNWSPSLIFPSLTKDDKVRVETLKAKRGDILDRDNRALATDGTAARIGIIPGKLGDQKEQTVTALSQQLGLSSEWINQQLSQKWAKEDSFVPLKTVPLDNQSLLNKVTKLQGVLTDQINARVYPCGEACSHIVGYTGSITADVLKEKEKDGYNAQSTIGRAGMEKAYEDKLRAVDGAVIYLQDARGNRKKEIARKDAKNGQNIKLTIDVDTQIAMYDQLKTETGVGVAVQPKTGEVIGLVSAPSFDSNDFALGISSKDYEALENDPKKPLINRITSKFSPGSTMKMVTSALILDNQTIKPNEKLKIDGPWQKDESWGKFHVNRVGSMPAVDLRDALVTSDNIYFAETAVKLGLTKYEEGAKKFGFGESLPIEYPAFKKSQLSNSGSLGSEIDLANSAYGQAQVLVNPLHLAMMYTSLVNDGNIIKPTLLANSKDGEVWKKQAMSPETASIIKQDLIQVVEAPNGTGHAAKLPNITLAAKTGTAELKEEQGTRGKENGWFVAVNTDNPRLLVAMMVADVKKGGSHYVVPKVKSIFEQYFANNK